MFGLAYGIAVVALPKANRRIVIGDAEGHYVQLRSAVFDRDLDFRNDYAGLEGLTVGSAIESSIAAAKATPTGYQRDFMPVCDMIRAPLVLVVHPSFPGTDLKSFIAEVKRQPGKLNFGSPGRGLAHHLAMEALKRRAGLDIVDVQYKGIAPVVQDTISGQIPIAVIDTVVLLPHLNEQFSHDVPGVDDAQQVIA